MSNEVDESDTNAASGCPVLHGFHPMRPDQIVDPFPLLAKARREVPVFYLAEHDEWYVTRYADVEQVLADTDVYSSAKFVDFPPFPDEIVAALPHGHPLEGTLVSTDPPSHTRIRKRAQKAFTPRQAEAHAKAVRALADALIDSFINDGKVDLAKKYCNQIPIRVIGPVLGVTPENAVKIYQWATDAMILVGHGKQMSQEQLLEMGRGQVELDHFVRDLVENRRKEPLGEDDFITSLIFATGDDGQPTLDTHEIVGVVTAAIAAGSDTSATTMAHCIRLLLEERSRWQALLAEPALIENAVEEALRLAGGARGVRRVTTRETVLNGVTLPKDATLFVHIASASRDEAVFENPDRFDLYRPNRKQHLSLGKWKHFCIGAPLARMEMRVGLEALTDRIPSMRLVPGHSIEYVPSIQVLPLIGGLVVDWDC